MGAERLIVDFERGADARMLLRVTGTLEQTTAPLLGGVLRALFDESVAIVVDLTGVDHMDARGVELLLAAEAEAIRTGSSIEVTGVSESLRARRPPPDGPVGPPIAG